MQVSTAGAQQVHQRLDQLTAAGARGISTDDEASEYGTAIGEALGPFNQGAADWVHRNVAEGGLIGIG
ncbi:hypothetical protein [Nocardia asteroides]|uniref:hypothetical protein n=1 Tax=Nocardia asteroides TaxID=1824 RepID=UPI0033CAA92C